MSGQKRLEGKTGKAAEKLLVRLTKLLNKQEIPYWLEGGTLLGIVRENRLLPWDNDVDISLRKVDEKRLLKILFRLRLMGYRVSVKYYKKSVDPFKEGQVRIVKVTNRKYLFAKGDVRLDLFLKLKKDDKYFWTVGIKKPVLKSVPATFNDNLGWVNFKNQDMMVPADIDGYLTFRYGDWKIPVKEYNFKKDDLAIVNANDNKEK